MVRRSLKTLFLLLLLPVSGGAAACGSEPCTSVSAQKMRASMNGDVCLPPDAPSIELGRVCPANGNNAYVCLYNEPEQLVILDGVAGLPGDQDPEDWQPCDFAGSDSPPLCAPN